MRGLPPGPVWRGARAAHGRGPGGQRGAWPRDRLGACAVGLEYSPVPRAARCGPVSCVPCTSGGGCGSVEGRADLARVTAGQSTPRGKRRGLRLTAHPHSQPVPAGPAVTQTQPHTQAARHAVHAGQHAGGWGPAQCPSRGHGLGLVRLERSPTLWAGWPAHRRGMRVGSRACLVARARLGASLPCLRERENPCAQSARRESMCPVLARSFGALWERGSTWNRGIVHGTGGKRGRAKQFARQRYGRSLRPSHRGRQRGGCGVGQGGRQPGCCGTCRGGGERITAAAAGPCHAAAGGWVPWEQPRVGRWRCIDSARAHGGQHDGAKRRIACGAGAAATPGQERFGHRCGDSSGAGACSARQRRGAPGRRAPAEERWGIPRGCEKDIWRQWRRRCWQGLSRVSSSSATNRLSALHAAAGGPACIAACGPGQPTSWAAVPSLRFHSSPAPSTPLCPPLFSIG
jgi:hypothetical protein